MPVVPLPSATTPSRRIDVLEGSMAVADEEGTVLTTVLGSCVACCLFDPYAALGGMNHFLLAEPSDVSLCRDVERYGVYAMEVLVNEMLKAGATRATMRAHLYGGANLHAGMRAIGTANATFAQEFLVRDGIALVRRDVGGSAARRVEFLAAAGKVRCRTVQGGAPVPPPRARPVAPQACGEVELF
jgi:chemotaxis protein CheD